MDIREMIHRIPMSRLVQRALTRKRSQDHAASDTIKTCCDGDSSNERGMMDRSQEEPLHLAMKFEHAIQDAMKARIETSL